MLLSWLRMSNPSMAKVRPALVKVFEMRAFQTRSLLLAPES